MANLNCPIYEQNNVSGMPGLGGRNPFHEISIGNELDMKISSYANAGQLRRIISANLASYVGNAAQNTNWNWVLTLGANIPQSTPGIGYTYPLTAMVKVGSGGGKWAFEVSCVPATTVNIVGPAVDVELYFDVNSRGGEVTNPVIQTDFKAYAYLSRGSVVSHPYRWFWISPSVGGAGSITGEVPVHAKGVTLFHGNVAAMFVVGTTLSFYDSDPTFTPAMAYTGVQLLQALVAGSYLPVPIGCTRWKLNYPVVGASSGKLSFALEI